MFHELFCATCNEVCKPVLATSPGELLSPDYEEEGASQTLLMLLRGFHERHRGHNHCLTTREHVRPPALSRVVK